MLVLCSHYLDVLWYIRFLLKSTVINKVQSYMKNEYLACQRQNIFHPVLWLEGQGHSLAVTEVNVRLCLPCTLLLDALWHWAVDIQKVIDLLLETREKMYNICVAKITLAGCSGYVFKHGTVYFPTAREGQSSVTSSHSLSKTSFSWERIALPLHSHYWLSCLYLLSY